MAFMGIHMQEVQRGSMPYKHNKSSLMPWYEWTYTCVIAYNLVSDTNPALEVWLEAASWHKKTLQGIDD